MWEICFVINAKEFNVTMFVVAMLINSSTDFNYFFMYLIGRAVVRKVLFNLLSPPKIY